MNARGIGGQGPRSVEHSIEFEVPFHDIDALKIVWHGNYLKYIDVARTALFRARGLDVEDLIRLGYRFVVIESHCRHAHALGYADRVRVTAWFRDLQHRLFVEYEIWNLTREERSARAYTVLATLDSDGRLLINTPRAIIDRLRVGS